MGHHVFSCLSLLLSTTVLNDIYIYLIITSTPKIKGKYQCTYRIYMYHITLALEC